MYNVSSLAWASEGEVTLLSVKKTNDGATRLQKKTST